MKNVLLRTMGDNMIGMGHISRCITLAKEFKKIGFKIIFVTSTNSKKYLKNHGKCYITNGIEKDEIKLIKKIKPQIYILDILKKFFSYSSNYFKQIKKFIKTMVAIDFVSKNLNFFDLSFHSLFEPKNYTAKKTYNSFKFSVVNNNFLKISKKYSIRKNIKNILILNGGSDTKCFGKKILKSIETLDHHLSITIVVGSESHCWGNSVIKNEFINKKINIVHNVKNMASLMKKFQLAISAAGVTSTELLTIGIPTLIVYGDPHEKYAANKLDSLGVAKNIGYGRTITQRTILYEVKKLEKNFRYRKKMHIKSRKLFDGNGGSRIIEIILKNYNKII